MDCAADSHRILGLQHRVHADVASTASKINHPPSRSVNGSRCLCRPMHIRTATIADLSRVMAIVRATVDAMGVYGNDQWDDTYPDEARFRRDVDAAALLVAERDGQVIGFITVDQDEPDGYRPLTWNG